MRPASRAVAIDVDTGIIAAMEHAGAAHLAEWFPAAHRPFWRRYFADSASALTCLAFVLPGALAFELGLRWAYGVAAPSSELLATAAIHAALGWLGASGSWLPLVFLVATLIAMQAASHKPWRVHWTVLVLMLAESALLAIPLLALNSIVLAAGGLDGRGAPLLRGVGAGIYEELIFRMVMVGGLTWLLIRVAKAQPGRSRWIAIGVATLLFAAAHFAPIGRRAPSAGAVAAYLSAGLYLSLVYSYRGFGVSAGCHALYNVLVILARGALALSA